MSKRGPRGLFLLVKRTIRPVVWMPMVSIATLTAILLTLPDSTIVAAESPAEPVVVVQAVETEKPAQNSEQPVAEPQPAPIAMPVSQPRPQPAPYCTTAGFGVPGLIDPVSAAPGVTAVTAAPTYYTFSGGTDHSQTLVRAADCARQQPSLGGAYHGLTSYIISAAYDTTSYGDNVCRIHNVRVTLNQAVLLPNADMAGMPATAVASWNAAAGRLQAHEYEHVAINRSHAQTMHDQLATLQGDCTQIASRAAAITEGGKANMRAANQALDARTQHGVQ